MCEIWRFEVNFLILAAIQVREGVREGGGGNFHL